MDTKSSPERTIGLTPEIQAILDDVYKGADASAAKEYLNKYIWTKLWQHVNRLCKAKATLEELLEHREAIKACMTMANDLHLEMASAKNASEKLKELYEKPFERAGR